MTNVPTQQGVSSCNLCHAKEFELLFPGNVGDNVLARFSQYAFYDDIYRCSRCKLVIQRQRHDIEIVGAFLKEEKYLDEAIGELNLVEKQVQFGALIALMQRFTPLSGKDLLDVGANTGVFLSTVQALVGSAKGIEASTEAATAAREKFGLDVKAGLIAEADLEDDAFDIMTMFDVIEHLTDPSGDLAFLHRKIAPGGILFITTHDIETWFAKISGCQYPMLMYQHFFHFSPRTLSMMLENAGFRVLGHKRFLKSWSFEYIYHLIEKKWPGMKLAGLMQFILSPLMKSHSVRKARIVSPQRDFFMIAAEKPRC